MTTSPEVTPNARPLHEDPAIYARRWFLLGVMCLSLVMVVMGVSGLNTAIPSIQRDLEATATDLQWIFDSYAIVFAGFLLTAGALGDRFGRKRALMFGLAVFGLGGAIGTFADTSTAVIVSRSVMGLGAAFVMPSTLSLLTSIFPPARAPQGDRAVGRLRWCWRRARPADRRVPPDGLVDLPVALVGIDVPRQHDRGCRGARRGRRARAREQGRAGHAARPGRGGAVARRPGVVAVRDHRGPDEGLVEHARSSVGSSSPRSRSARSSGGSSTPSTRCCRCRSSASAASRPAAASSRSRSS